MAYEDEELIRHLQNIRRLRGQDVLSRVAALPGTFHSALNEGPTAAANYAMQFRQQGQFRGLDPEKAYQLKIQLLDKRAQLEAAQGRNRASNASSQALNAMNAYKYAMDAVFGAYGAYASGSASVASSYNSAGANSANALMDLVVGLAAPGSSDADQQNLYDFRSAIQKLNIGAGDLDANAQNPVLFDDLAQKLLTMPEKNKGAALAALDLYATQSGVPNGIHGLVALAPPEARGQAQFIIEEAGRYGTQIADTLDQAKTQGILIAKKESEERLRGIAGPNYEKMWSAVEQMAQGILAGDMDAGMKQASAGIDSITDDDAGTPTLDQMDKLLADLDQPQEFIPATAKEAKMQLLRSQEFQEWKQANGLMDDGMAFKAFRRHFGEKIRENKRADAITMQKMQAGGAVMPNDQRQAVAQPAPQVRPTAVAPTAAPVQPPGFAPGIQGYSARTPAQLISQRLAGGRKPFG
jgi:hypothetical protein